MILEIILIAAFCFVVWLYLYYKVYNRLDCKNPKKELALGVLINKEYIGATEEFFFLVKSNGNSVRVEANLHQFYSKSLGDIIVYYYLSGRFSGKYIKASINTK